MDISSELGQNIEEEGMGTEWKPSIISALYIISCRQNQFH